MDKDAYIAELINARRVILGLCGINETSKKIAEALTRLINEVEKHE